MSDLMASPATSVKTGKQVSNAPIIESGDQSKIPHVANNGGNGGGLIKGPGASKPDISPANG